MVLWIGFGILTAAVVAALLRSLARDGDLTLDSRAADLAVYRDQLGEIERERADGVLQPAEAESARAEIARRMLARGDVVAQPDVGGQREPAGRGQAGRGQAGRMAALASVPLAAVALYLMYGSPWLPGQPHAARVTVRPEQGGVAELLAKVEARLREHPEDGQGWDVLGPVYLMHQRHGDAAEAFRRSISLLGPSAKRYWGLAQSLIGAADGLVSEEARLVLEKLVALEPSRLEARFWLASAKEQDGKREAAAAEYRAILAEAPASAPWRTAVEERLVGLDDGAAGNRGPRLSTASDGVPVLPPGMPTRDRGPNASDVATAQDMAPEARAEVIGRMVAQLAERLQADGRDLAGWQKLVRAYKVLGREGEARKAVLDARANFTGNATALAEIDALARSLGLGG